MKILLKIVMLLGLMAFTLRSDVLDIQKDMVRFDQAYIPLWLYVHQGDMTKAKSSVFVMEFHWQRLRSKYENAVEEEDWTETFRRVNDWLGDAYFAIDANRPHMASNQLDHARYEMQYLRGRYRIPYYLDHIYDLQDEVYGLIEIADDRALCMMAWPEIEVLATSALQHWRNHKDEPLNAELYGLDAADMQLLKSRQAQMEKALEDFQAIVETAEREAMAAESSELEDAFIQLLSVFGKFDSEQSSFAQQ